MEKIVLSQGTIDALKQIDTTYDNINEKAQAYLNGLNAQIQALAEQKNMILNVIRAEKGISPSIKLRLNADYSLEEITEEEFNQLTTSADMKVKDIIE